MAVKSVEFAPVLPYGAVDEEKKDDIARVGESALREVLTPEKYAKLKRWQKNIFNMKVEAIKSLMSSGVEIEKLILFPHYT